MKPISAIDAISPAFQRTRAVIAQPFRLGFFLKLVVVATFSAGNMIALGILLPMQGSSLLFQIMMARHGAGSTTPSPFQNLPAASFGPAFFAVLAICGLVFLLVSAAFYYVFTRFRFIIFDTVLLGERKFSRSWTKFGSQTWRYYGLSILIAMACMLAATTVAAPLTLISLRMLRSASSEAAPASSFGYLIVSVMIEYMLIFVATVIDGWTHDFLMPPMAIEDASIERSFGRFTALLREDFAAVFVFTLLRLALRIALTIALTIVMVIPVAIFAFILVGIGFLLFHLLWSAGLGGQVVFGVYAATAGLTAFALYMAAIFCAAGIVAVFTQAYGIIFYAARYPALGNILNPPSPVAVEVIHEISPEPPPSTPPPFLPEPPALW